MQNKNVERFYFLGLVFVLNGSGTLLSYSSMKDSRYAVLIAMVLGMLGSAVWLMMARSLGSPDRILATGFQADLAAKAAGILIPLIIFGVRCDWRTALGIALMVTGAMALR